MKINNYFFNTVVFRTPFFPYSHIHSIDYRNAIFNELIQFASPELLSEKLKDEESGEYSRKMQQTLYKYWTRASFRCTPFGLFAGCSTASISNNTEIIIDSNSSMYTKNSRLDMNFLGALIQELLKNDNIKYRLVYYPNDSIYRTGEFIRYIEYSYTKTNRIYTISSVRIDKYINLILNMSKNGVSYQKLFESLSTYFEKDEVKVFLNDVISSQLLKSELELSVTGADQLSRIMTIIEKIDGCESIVSKLKNIKECIMEIDRMPIDGFISKYDYLESLINELHIPFSRKYLLQTDLYKRTHKSVLSYKVTQDLQEAITILGILKVNNTNPNLHKFKTDYKKRYEEQMMPLLNVLDPELGIGYSDIIYFDQNPLLDGVLYNKPDSNTTTINRGSYDKYFQNKYIDCITKGDGIIDISDIDIGRNSQTQILPDTISVMCSIYQDNIIDIKSVSGPCATTLLGRFCHLDKKIEDLCHEIIQTEETNNPNLIYAEIVHLPEDRVGNILLRPILRNYEIPFLSNTSVDKDNIIRLSDLLIGIINDEIILYSKKLKKRIMPRLSSAHNYSTSKLPIYKFLCDLQSQGRKSSLSFKLPICLENFDYIPRIVYKNCVLYKSTWKITKENFETFKHDYNIDNYIAIRHYIIAKKIPRIITIPDGDNTLLIDFYNDVAVDIFIKELTKRGNITLQEVLSNSDNLLIKDDINLGYTNEFIFTLSTL